MNFKKIVNNVIQILSTTIICVERCNFCKIKQTVHKNENKDTSTTKVKELTRH